MSLTNLEIREEVEDYITNCTGYVCDFASARIDVYDFMKNIGKMFNPEQFELTIGEKQELLNRLTKAFNSCIRVVSKKYM